MQYNVNIHKADHFTWGCVIFFPSYTTLYEQRKSHSIRLLLGLEIDRMSKSIWWCTVSSYSISKMNTKKYNNVRVKWKQTNMWNGIQESCLFIQKLLNVPSKKHTQAYVPIHQRNYDGIKIEKFMFFLSKSQFGVIKAWQYYCVRFLFILKWKFFRLWGGSKSISIK